MNWREIVDNAKEHAVDNMDTKSVITKFLAKCDTLHLSDQQKIKLLQKIVIEAGAQIDVLQKDVVDHM